MPPVFWAIIILFLSLTPSHEMPETNIWEFLSFDKLAHLFFYTLLSLQLIIAFKKQNSNSILKHNAILIGFILSLFYGIILETLQYYIYVGRTADLIDIIANLIGAFLGVSLFFIIYNQPLKQY